MTKHQQKLEETKKLVKAIKFNHDIPDGRTFRIKVKDVEKELDEYEHRAAKLSLPHRFGMYKTPAKAKAEKIEDLELEEPSTEEHEVIPDPNHKKRGIFD